MVGISKGNFLNEFLKRYSEITSRMEKQGIKPTLIILLAWNEYSLWPENIVHTPIYHVRKYSAYPKTNAQFLLKYSLIESCL